MVFTIQDVEDFNKAAYALYLKNDRRLSNLWLDTANAVEKFGGNRAAAIKRANKEVRKAMEYYGFAPRRRKNPEGSESQDEKIRELERKYRESNDPEDERKLLVALNRAGNIQRLVIGQDLDWNTFINQAEHWRHVQYVIHNEAMSLKRAEDAVYDSYNLTHWEDRASYYVNRIWHTAVERAFALGMPRRGGRGEIVVVGEPMFPSQGGGPGGTTRTVFHGDRDLFVFLIALAMIVEELDLDPPVFPVLPSDNMRIQEAGVKLARRIYRELGFDLSGPGLEKLPGE
jgi:hypothetical protein